MSICKRKINCRYVLCITILYIKRIKCSNYSNGYIKNVHVGVVDIKLQWFPLYYRKPYEYCDAKERSGEAITHTPTNVCVSHTAHVIYISR